MAIRFEAQHYEIGIPVVEFSESATRHDPLAALNRDGVRLIINSELLQASVQVSEEFRAWSARQCDHRGEGAFTAGYCEAECDF
jgi:hypothetical protein